MDILHLPVYTFFRNGKYYRPESRLPKREIGCRNWKLETGNWPSA